MKVNVTRTKMSHDEWERQINERIMNEFEKNLKVYRVYHGAVVCLASLILMILAQIPTPEYLNPVGCLFALIFLASGIWMFMGFLFSIP